MGQRVRAVVLATLIAAVAGSAQASTLVLGGGMAEACSRAAFIASVGAGTQGDAVPLSLSQAVQACSRALTEEMLDRRDMAATYVNRGVLLMERQDYQAALSDFDDAVQMRPHLSEARVNRGAALVAQRHYREGIEELTIGISMAPEQIEKAYYNRAIAHEALGDLKAAYFDYLKASELKPEWGAPRAELVRFTVKGR